MTRKLGTLCCFGHRLREYLRSCSHLSLYQYPSDPSTDDTKRANISRPATTKPIGPKRPLGSTTLRGSNRLESPANTREVPRIRFNSGEPRDIDDPSDDVYCGEILEKRGGNWNKWIKSLARVLDRRGLLEIAKSAGDCNNLAKLQRCRSLIAASVSRDVKYLVIFKNTDAPCLMMLVLAEEYRPLSIRDGLYGYEACWPIDIYDY